MRWFGAGTMAPSHSVSVDFIHWTQMQRRKEANSELYKAVVIVNIFMHGLFLFNHQNK